MKKQELEKLIKKQDRLASGHRSCRGCLMPVITRHVLRAVDKPVVVISATSCQEVTTTLYPETSWNVPWIHSVFANCGATASGVSRAYKVLKEKRKLKNISASLEKKDIKFVAFGGDGGCYSSDTEVFTERGFVSVKRMKIGEKIWSINPQTNELEKTKIERIFKYKFKGKMIRGKSKFIDFLVTPDHNIPIWCNGNWKFIKARDLKKRYKTFFMRRFNWHGKRKKFFTIPKIKKYTCQKEYTRFPMKKWLRFLGWYISEGSLYKSSSGYLIRIYQSNSKNKEEIFNLLTDLKIKAFKCARSVDIQSKQIYEYLKENCGKGWKDKKIPKEILDLDKEYLREIFGTLIQGDGSIWKSKDKNRKIPKIVYITGAKALRDSFVELCLKLGYGCTVREDKRENSLKYILGISKIYTKNCLYTKRKLYESYGIKQVSEEFYNGKVYCPQLNKNHILIIKRNGKISANGNSYDIGFQALSGALERGENFLYICYDNEAYMNTGNQRSSATPYAASTTTTPPDTNSFGKPEFRKNLTEIVAAHSIPYVAQASVAFWEDLYQKVKKAVSKKGPSFINILSPCTLGWKFETDLGIELSRLAVETCFWPLYEVENGKYKLNYKPLKKKPIEEFLKLQGRFKHLFKDKKRTDVLKRIQKHIDSEWKKILEKCKI